MTADPVQVLVTIHPPDGWDFDWVFQVHEALINPRVTLWQADGFECDLVRGRPHGEAKAHREAAEAALESAQVALAHVPALAAQTHSLAAIAHALLALGERP